MTYKVCIVLKSWLLFGVVFCQLPSPPEISNEIASTTKPINSFVNIWKHSLKFDASDPPVTRNVVVAKTLLIPSDLFMINLIPQDVAHPLYVVDEKHSELRKQFLLDHLSTQPVDLESPELLTKKGLTIQVLSGNKVTFRKDDSGVTANGVTVEGDEQLKDGVHVMVLSDPLFEQAARVRSAFDKLPQVPFTAFGPPLTIPEPPPSLNGGARAPAPPTSNSGPPAPPTAEEFATFLSESDTPPALPSNIITEENQKPSSFKRKPIPPPINGQIPIENKLAFMGIVPQALPPARPEPILKEDSLQK